MLDVDPDTRSTANQLLNSPWIMVRHAVDAHLFYY